MVSALRVPLVQAIMPMVREGLVPRPPWPSRLFTLNGLTGKLHVGENEFGIGFFFRLSNMVSPFIESAESRCFDEHGLQVGARAAMK